MYAHQPLSPHLSFQELKQLPKIQQILYNKAFVNKQVEFIKWICCRHFDSHFDKKDVRRLILEQKRGLHKPLHPAPKGISIQLDTHAFQRWNERISPCQNLNALRTRMIQLLHLERIHLSPKGWGWIDRDILFGYKLNGQTLIIQTFIGRISLIPALANYKAVLRFNSIQNDRLDLAIPPLVLKQQQLPLIPREVVKFSGSRNHYQLEEYLYTNPDGSVAAIFALQILQGNQISYRLIDPVEPPNLKLFRSVLYLLLLKGYQDYVLQHIVIHKADKLQKLLQKRDTLPTQLKNIV
jgi:hypothetical protein